MRPAAIGWRPSNRTNPPPRAGPGPIAARRPNRESEHMARPSARAQIDQQQNRSKPQEGRAAVIRLPLAAVALICAVATAQSAQVSFYQLPSGSYPHDVAPALDGAVWFTGQAQGFLGHFDPASEKLEKISLGRGAAPHGVIVGPDGAAWVCEGGQNAIARVDQNTKEVKLFPLPKEFSAANLNTLTFDKAGIAWLTGQSGVYGRPDPKA